MYFKANEPIRVYTHHKIKTVVDGDGMIVYNIFNKKETEIRLLGIDAPEIKVNKKLKQDERELHLPGQLLIELGKMSWKFLFDLVPKETDITFITEIDNEIDLFGRTLAYVIIKDGTCINEKLIEEGYAKPYTKYYCSKLETYQKLNFNAMHLKKGLYSFLHNF
jgi:micrococcal nuclease